MTRHNFHIEYLNYQKQFALETARTAWTQLVADGTLDTVFHDGIVKGAYCFKLDLTIAPF